MAETASHAEQIGELKAKVENNQKVSERLMDAITKQNDAIQRLERSMERLGDAVSRIAEDRNDLKQFKEEIKSQISGIDKQIKEEIELLKEDLNRRRGAMDAIVAIIKTSPIWGVIAALSYAGYVYLTGDASAGVKP